MDLTAMSEDLMAYAPLPPSGSRLWTEEACWKVVAAAGITRLAIQSSDHSAPILSRVGFTKCAEPTILRRPVT